VADDNEDRVKVVETDFNLLTGDIIFKREVVGGKGRHKWLQRDKATGGPCLFESYDRDLYFCMDSWKTKDGKLVSDQMVP
jgi:hypothetical protein